MARWLLTHTTPENGWSVYLLLAGLSYVLLLALTVRRVRLPFWLLAAALTLYLFRWPGLAAETQFNPDETMAIAIAPRLGTAFFQQADSTTLGPLYFYSLAVPYWLGFGYSYGAARLMGLAVMLLALGLVVRALEALAGRGPAQLAGLTWVTVACWATSTIDSLTYASEIPALAVLGALTLGLARLRQSPSTLLALTLGGLLALVPYSKLQATLCGLPLAVAIFLAARKRAPDVVLALLAVSAGLALLWTQGDFEALLRGYIQGNLDHASQVRERGLEMASGGLGPRLANLRYVLASEDFRYYYLGLALAALAAGRAWLRADRYWLGLGGAWALATLGAMLLGGSRLRHYNWLLVPPLTLVFGVLLQRLEGRRALLVTALALLPGWTLKSLGTCENSLSIAQLVLRGPRAAEFQYHAAPVVNLIHAVSAPGEPIAVWGYLPSLYVAARRPPATRDTTNERQLEPRFKLDYYRPRYLADLAVSQPVVLVDTTGVPYAAYADRATAGIGAFPELQAIADRDYVRLGDVAGFLVYVRKDRYRR